MSSIDLILLLLILLSSSSHFSEFSSQARVQVFLVDLAFLFVPVVVCQQGHVPGSDGAHLHGTCCPLHSIKVVQPVVQDERRGLAVRRMVRGVCQPFGLRHRIIGEEHVLQLLLRQWLFREHLPDISLASRGALVTFGDVHRIQRAQAVDDGTVWVCGEDIRHGELWGSFSGPQVRHVEQAVDKSGDCLVVVPGVVRRDWRGKAWKCDVRFPPVKRRCYYHNIIKGMCSSWLVNIVNLV